MKTNLNVANGQLTEEGLERVLVSALSAKPYMRTAAASTTLRTAVTPTAPRANTAPPPPDYNAAVRAAAKAPAPAYVYPRQAGTGAPKPPTFADFNAAVCRKAQAAHTRR